MRRAWSTLLDQAAEKIRSAKLATNSPKSYRRAILELFGVTIQEGE